MTSTQSKTVKKQVGVQDRVGPDGKPKPIYQSEIRTFLWDNTEIRRAFREAQDNERKQ